MSDSKSNFSAREELGYNLLWVANALNDPEDFYNVSLMFPDVDLPVAQTPERIFRESINAFIETMNEVANTCLTLNSDSLIRSAHAVVEIARFELAEPCVMFFDDTDSLYCETYLKVLYRLNSDVRLELQRLGGKLIAEQRLLEPESNKKQTSGNQYPWKQHKISLTSDTQRVAKLAWDNPAHSISFVDASDDHVKSITKNSAQRIRRNFNAAMACTQYSMSLSKEHFTIICEETSNSASLTP